MRFDEQIKKIKERNMKIKERDRRIHKTRETYRDDLDAARKELGCFIPFGANLDLYKKRWEIIKSKSKNKFNLPLFFFDHENGKEVCKNMCLIEKYKLRDGREILVGILTEKVELEKDEILKEFFDKMKYEV